MRICGQIKIIFNVEIIREFIACPTKAPAGSNSDYHWSIYNRDSWTNMANKSENLKQKKHRNFNLWIAHITHW